jgi:heterotetrameric sarcosine oxidase gamma subunit
VPDRSPIAHSPIGPLGPTRVIDGWVRSGPVSRAPLTLADLSHLSKVLARSTEHGALARALAVNLGCCARREGGGWVAGSGPGEWTVLTDSPAAMVVSELTAAAGSEFATVIDLTHARALIRVTGAAGSDLLAKVCAVDLSDRVTPAGSAFRSSVAKVVTDVLALREAAGDPPSYLLHVDRSLGQYLFDCLLDAGAEFGIEVARAEPRGV